MSVGLHHPGDGRRRAVYGRNVIVAARLEALGRPGDILLSSNVYDEVDRHIQTRCEALGHRKVKHVTQPVDVYRIGP